MYTKHTPTVHSLTHKQSHQNTHAHIKTPRDYTVITRNCRRPYRHIAHDPTSLYVAPRTTPLPSSRQTTPHRHRLPTGRTNVNPFRLATVCAPASPSSSCSWTDQWFVITSDRDPSAMAARTAVSVTASKTSVHGIALTITPMSTVAHRRLESARIAAYGR